MPRAITSFSNDTVKRLRSLRDKKARREEGLFLAEGLRILAEARDSGRLPARVTSAVARTAATGGSRFASAMMRAGSASRRKSKASCPWRDACSSRSAARNGTPRCSSPWICRNRLTSWNENWVPPLRRGVTKPHFCR